MRQVSHADHPRPQVDNAHVSTASKSSHSGLTCGEAAAELAEDRGVEARVVDVQPQHVLPVEPRAHRVGGLPVREPLRELQDRRQREPPGRERGLAAAPEERREGIIGEKLPELVRSAQKGVALREGGAGDPGGLGGDRRERLGAQHHDPLGGATTMTASAAYQATLTNAQERCHNIRQHSQQRGNPSSATCRSGGRS